MKLMTNGQPLTDSKTPPATTKVLLFALTSSWVIVAGVATTFAQHRSYSILTNPRNDGSSCGFVSFRSYSRFFLLRRHHDTCSCCCCCCFHFRRRRSQSSSSQNGDDHSKIMYPIFAHTQFSSSSFCDELPKVQSQPRLSLDAKKNTQDHHDDKEEHKYEECGNYSIRQSQDRVVSSLSYPDSSTLLHIHSSATANHHRNKVDTQEAGKRIHYNDALLKRILNGRASHSQSWRKRTRRAAVALGIPYSSSSSSTRLSKIHFPSWSWIPTRIPHFIKTEKDYTGKTVEKYNSPASLSSIKQIPPKSSALVVQSYQSDDDEAAIHMNDPSSKKNYTHRSATLRWSQPPFFETMDDIQSSTDLLLKKTTHISKPMYEDTPLNSKKSKIKISSLNSSSSLGRHNKPLTKEEYDRAKEEWTKRYTNLSNLRSTFGTNRNKFWGDFDPETTRKLYKTLLPRALLGLYEMGLCSPKDLAPLAYEARLAAKRYARERCVVPGRIASMVYDGFRSWKTYGKWNVEGMSYEQVWYKYESQIIGELGKYNGGNYDKLISVMQEEITALVCLRILERSCITNEAIDRLFLKDRPMDTNSTFLETKNARYDIRRRNRKAERDIARIAAQLEHDMEVLLQTPVVSKSMMRNWKESISGNATSYARLINTTMFKDSKATDEESKTIKRVKQKDIIYGEEEKDESLSHFLDYWLEKTRHILMPLNGTSISMNDLQPVRSIPTFITPSFDMKMDDAQMVLSSISLSTDQTSYDFWNRLMSKVESNKTRFKY